MNHPDEQDPTRDRILQSALEIFADRGFKATTVRDICTHAGVNVASVNYHFRSKEALYKEVLVYSFKEADRKYPPATLMSDLLPAEERLRFFIRNLLLRLMDDGREGLHAKLMAREIVDPTAALDYVVETVMRPRFIMLRDLLPQFVGGGWPAADIDRFILGVIGQCLVYRHARPMVDQLCPEVASTADAIDRTAEVIFRFSLAGLRQLSREEGAQS